MSLSSFDIKNAINDFSVALSSFSTRSILFPLYVQHLLSARQLWRASHKHHLFLWSILFLVAAFGLVYVATWISFLTHTQSRELVKIPPTIPYFIPFFGHAFELFLDPVKALARINRSVGPRPVYGLKVLGHDVYFIHGPENIARLRTYPTSITLPAVTTFILKTVLGMPAYATDMYTLDDSGVATKPKPGSSVKPSNRVDHLTYANFHKHLLGEGLSGLYQSFAASLMHRLPSLDIQEKWKYCPDLEDFWLQPMTAAMNEAIAGPVLECVSPKFAADLLQYYPYLHPLMKGLPRWLIPKAYKLQRSLVRDVEIWHAIARARFQADDVDPKTGRDPWWGSAFMRERQKILGQIDNWDLHAIAVSDFGVFWGASVNIHPMSILGLVEIFKDRDLLHRLRGELARIDFSDMMNGEAIEKVLAIPLLQSIYAELLRLRIAIHTVLHSGPEDVCINEWRIPKGSLILVPADNAHRDAEFWNTKDGQYPLDRFWAERFLVYPDDRRSGPRKLKRDEEVEVTRPRKQVHDARPKFSNSGLADSYMPYGMGERVCPGRGFARREIMMFCALIVDRYDIEFLSEGCEFEVSGAFYGIGTQRPKGQIPFQIRKRQDG